MDGLLEQGRIMQINSSFIKYDFLLENRFDDFMLEIENGREVPREELDQFVMLLPSQQEEKKFKERLAEHNVDSFKELLNPQKTFVLKKLEKAEEFVIKVLSNEGIMDKAKII